MDDCGGGYSESIAEICEELQNGLTPLLIVTPNGRDESGANRDCYLLSPAARAPVHTGMFRFLGGSTPPLGCRRVQGRGSRGGAELQHPPSPPGVSLWLVLAGDRPGAHRDAQGCCTLRARGPSPIPGFVPRPPAPTLLSL